MLPKNAAVYQHAIITFASVYKKKLTIIILRPSRLHKFVCNYFTSILNKEHKHFEFYGHNEANVFDKYILKENVR